ncbi:MAG: hypothetical protein ACD_22C00256G0009 [uncultured bacterium]|nr:MAG: hypothetical protein ACD_22C00256G0009 [uncultured bacterium]
METQKPLTPGTVDGKLSRVDWVALIGGLFITSLIFKIGNFGFIPALIIGFGAYWITKKIAILLLEKKNIPVAPKTTASSSIKKKPQLRKTTLLFIAIVTFCGILYLLLTSAQSITTQSTDKSIENSQVDGNLYRNTKYKFRIKFPEGWEIKQGDGPSIVQKAVSGNHSLSIGVKAMDVGNSYTIKDILTIDELKMSIVDSMQKQYPDIKVLNYGETKIDNIPAYWIKYSMSYSAMNVTFKAVNTQYQVLKGDNYYFITAGSTADEFDSVERDFVKSVSSFVFEDY